MARNITIDQLEADARWQCDQVGATTRHLSADIFRAINQSIQHFRLKVSRHGIRRYLTPKSGTLPVGATSPYAFGVLDFSAFNPSVVEFFGFEITVQGKVDPLEQVDFDLRNEFQSPFATAIGSAPPVAVAEFGTNLAILPASDGAYPYTAWYLPVSADLTTGQTFDGVNGWEQWITYDVAIKIAARDQYEKVFGILSSRQGEIWADIERASPSRQTGLIRRTDSRGLRSDRIRNYRNREIFR